jgi:uncharacterized protein (DUF1778 family)
MSKKDNQKEKVLTIRVSYNQYEKIQQLAQIREMNITEYIRNSAVGNRIKPTVIESDNSDQEQRIQRLRKELNKAKEHEKTLRHFLKCIENNGEYINISKYKNDEILKQRIKNAMEILIK